DHVGIAVAVDIAGRHVDAHVKIDPIGEELGQQTGAVRVKGVGGDVLTAVDVDVGVADVGAGNDVRIAVVVDVAHRHRGADIEIHPIGKPPDQETGVGVGRIKGAGGKGFAVVDVDVGIAGSGGGDDVLITVVIDVAHRDVDAVRVRGSIGREV